MKISRNVARGGHFLFDTVLPPLLRDSRWFMTVFFRVFLGGKFRHYLDFKDRLLELSDLELRKLYEHLVDSFVERETDLNRECATAVLRSLFGKTVLDAGCGRGWLSKRIVETGRSCVAVDFVVTRETNREVKTSGRSLGEGIVAKAETGRERSPAQGPVTGPAYCVAEIHNLPFADAAFDTVVCAHTLEHVRDIRRALSELRRVTRNRLIVVLPRQREYRYTFDLHVHFFPYDYKVRELFGAAAAVSLEGGDFLIIEDRVRFARTSDGDVASWKP